MFAVCLLVSTVEFALIHLSNIFSLVPLFLGPFIVGWQAAMPLAYFQSLQGKAALDRSWQCLRGARMMVPTALALATVRALPSVRYVGASCVRSLFPVDCESDCVRSAWSSAANAADMM